MSNKLGAQDMLELVDSLKATVQEFAARSEKVNGEFHTQSLRERQRCEAALQEQAVQLSASLTEAEVAFQDMQAAAEAKYEKRKGRIGRAYQSSREQGLKRIEDRIGALKYDLQKKMLQAERDRGDGLATTAADFAEFRRNLAAAQASLAELEGAAQRAFRGYRKLLRQFFDAYEKADADAAGDENHLLGELRELLARTEGELKRLRKSVLLQLGKLFRPWFVLALAVCALALPAVLPRFGITSYTYREAGLSLGGLAFLFALRFLGSRRAEPLTASICAALARARRLHNACEEKSEVHRQQEVERVKSEFESTTQVADKQLKEALAAASEARVSCRIESDERTVRITAKNEAKHSARIEALEGEHTNTVERLNRAAEVRTQALSAASEEQLKKLTANYDAGWQALEAEWKSKTRTIYQAVEAATSVTDKLFPPWSGGAWKDWAPPRQFAQTAKFGQINVDVQKLCESAPKDKRLVLPGPSQFALPLCLVYPDQGSVLFETAEGGQDQAIASLNDIVLRLLSVAPPGRLNFTILDPVGLGQNFAGIMHIADYEEQIINNRIWTQTTQIEEKLADLNEHMEKVIQMYLRNEYQTIAEYNRQAGVIAEKYHFLVVADFPANFTETAAKRLLSIAASGARCGVYMLIHWDRRLPLPQEFIPDELRKSAISLACQGRNFSVKGRSPLGAELVLEEPPTAEMAIEFIHQVGRASRDSSRVEVPFTHVVPPDAEIWTEDTTTELRVPIGRTGATKLQYLAIGKGTCQHGLVAGKTGSGKSTLFHVIITNLALWCSPEQVEFYLVDFKKGVEFKCYASRRLPHARVVAIESDREFGLSVLQRVDEELKRRGDLFRELGVQDIAGYKRAGGTQHIPRSLLLIDEFQEFFVEDDHISQTASLLLDRIVRQGRAFGIHVLLGSQTLGGAYTVARTTLGQMVIRIALQCNEADAYLIMDDTNPAPRLLSRPGEGIYNDMAGALEGNSPFQVVWLPDEVRDNYLARVRKRADEVEVRNPKSEVRSAERGGRVYPGPIVFEGNAPADVRENLLLRDLLEAKSVQRAVAPRIWLGAPNSIKGPTEAVFHRQSGNNLLVVGQREEATLAILSTALVSLAAQFPVGTARIILCDGTPPGSPQRDFIQRILRAIPHQITLPKQNDLPEVMKDLAAEMKKRAEDADADAAPPVFLVLYGLQKYSKLRYEEDFGFSTSGAEAAPNPAAILNNMICEGTRLGFHVIATCDTYNNVSRFLSRKAMSEFGMRVLFQMSPNDSASLIDSPKAGLLGLHRALYYNAQEGHLETFRPYALPSHDWIEQITRDLSRLLQT